MPHIGKGGGKFRDFSKNFTFFANFFTKRCENPCLNSLFCYATRWVGIFPVLAFKFPFATISRFSSKREFWLKGNLTRASSMKLAAAMPKLFSIKFKFPFGCFSRFKLKRKICHLGNLARASSMSLRGSGKFKKGLPKKLPFCKFNKAQKSELRLDLFVVFDGFI